MLDVLSRWGEVKKVAMIVHLEKSVSINPLKLSRPLGAVLAMLGIKGAIPLVHGAQGCASFTKVLLVRHFREAIPLATTAMTEITTILGGEGNIQKAILKVIEKSNPDIIGLISTSLVETKGDDVRGALEALKKKHQEQGNVPIVPVFVPDYKGSLEDGYATCVKTLVSHFANKETIRARRKRSYQVNILAGPSLTPGDIDEVKDIITSFGLSPVVLPDLSLSVDGHLGDEFNPVVPDGTTLEELCSLGSSCFTLALGESMRGAAEILENNFDIPYKVFPSLLGLDVVDGFISDLMHISGHCVPTKIIRDRKRLQDAMLDAHFYFGNKSIALALEPELLYQIARFFLHMGANIKTLISPVYSLILEKIPVDKVYVGDLQDLEDLSFGSDLIVTNSHGVGIARKLHIPIFRLGMPIFDRLGEPLRVKVGYRGTSKLLFDIGNVFLEQEEEVLERRNKPKNNALKKYVRDDYACCL